MKPKVIVFTGKMGSGKTTAINLLKELMPEHNFVSIKFAQPLYDMQEYIYTRISDVHRRSETFVKDRKLLQFLGTDWGRNTISESLWLDIWKDSVRRFTVQLSQSKTPAVIVTDDCRFLNEAAVVSEVGGIIVQIKSTKQGERIKLEGISHQSELELEKINPDFIIQNNGSLDDLKMDLRDLIHYASLNIEGN